MKKIDINFNFTTDTSNYWEGFWEKDNILGGGGNDPDAASKTLQTYHKILWSKALPNGQKISLSTGTGANYLTWEDFRFGSDSIIASFRYVRYRHMLEEVANTMPNYKAFLEDFIHKTYTIGGSIIFPKENSINCARGCNHYIKDRWDLTLECIRRYYNNENNPLYEVLEKNKKFFDLFRDFKGYVDFFFLQDCVSADYNSVEFWIGNGDFDGYPLPKTVNEYKQWIYNQLEFLSKRNKRIENAIKADGI